MENRLVFFMIKIRVYLCHPIVYAEFHKNSATVYLRLSFVESADVRFSCLCNLTSVNQCSALEPALVVFFANASSIGSDQPA